MGYYIEVPKNKEKAQQLVNIYKATIIPCPVSLEDIPTDKALICVVDNRAFEAAGYCFSQNEFEAFRHDFGLRQRPRQWVLMDKSLARKLSGFRE